MFRVQTDLMLWSPKPEQIQADAEGNGRSTNECSAKCNHHRQVESGVSARQNWSCLFERWLHGFLDRLVSFPSFVLKRDVLDRDGIRVGVEIGEDFVF